MKRSSHKFLHRVRIHGGEFDASARAMHRDGMTSSFQAAVEIVSIATNERKQMSTKTTFKRVALVAVASMGFGLLSVVPSSAAAIGDSLTLDVTGTKSATIVAGDTATAVVTQKFTALAAGDSMSVQAVLTDYPTGASATPILLTASDSLTAILGYGSSNDITATESKSNGGTNTIAFAGMTGAGAAMAAYNVSVLAPSVAGTYKVGLYAAKVSQGTAGAAGAPSLTWTIVVTAKDVNASAALTTSFIAAGNATPAIVDSATVSGPMAVTSGQAATILVSQVNSAGTANESMTVVVSGPGIVSGQSATTGSRDTNAGRAITVQKGHNIAVFSDGSSGVAKITITGNTSKVVLGEETVTFYGAVATITTTVRTAIVSSTGGATSGASALVAVVKDSLGTVIPTGSVYAQSGTTASIPDATCTYSSTYKGHACSLVPVASKTGSVVFTVRSAVRATTVASTTISAADVSVTLGEAPKTVAFSWDKSTYLPGETGYLSVTITDKNGKPVANGIYADILDADFIDTTYSLGTSLDTHTVTAAKSTGTMVLTVNMPVAEVNVAVTAVTGTGFATLADQGVDVAAPVVSIKSASGSAATDAANEAIDAANAATDAANAAAEAADAATAAAQDALDAITELSMQVADQLTEATEAANAATDAANAASEAGDAATAAAQDAADAVAALSTQVAELISALKAQITSLTNLVIKIQKKIKA